MPLIEFEVELARMSGDAYRVRISVSDPERDQLPDTSFGELIFRWDELDAAIEQGNLNLYAALLSVDFFDGSGSKVKDRLRSAVNTAGDEGQIRFRLSIDESAERLNTLLWEILIDPISEEKSDLCSNPNIFFSRALQRGRSRQYTLRHKYQIRALAVISNPKFPHSTVPAHPISIEDEESRVREGLKELTVNVLATSDDQPGKTSLDSILAALDEPYDVLYVVCHGSFDLQLSDSQLNLETPTGHLDRVTGKEFVTRLERLPMLPSLVILCACQSAGNGQLEKASGADRSANRVMTSLGPRLVRAGIPAVIAMQGNLTMATGGTFFNVLFAKLQESGVIDSAVGAARSSIAGSRDAFVPVLFQRIRSGRIWYGAQDHVSSDVNWDGLLSDIKDGNGTVIMGSALLDPYIGAQSEVAMQLAQRHNYPFADSERDDLAMVGQYLSSSIGRNAFQNEVIREWLKQVLRNYSLQIPDLLRESTKEQLTNASEPNEELQRALGQAWRYRSSKNRNEPHNVLARLPFKSYISTNPDTLLESALFSKVGPGESPVSPVVWKIGTEPPRRVSTFRPTALRPLIAFLYGTIENPNSLVLTEDDYYQQLIVAAEAERNFVLSLNSVFTSSSLIFLGFRLHEWDFRVLFRRLKMIEGWGNHLKFTNVAVQIDPSTSRGTANERTVRNYLSYIFAGSNIKTFRGSLDDFLKELEARCHAKGIPMRRERDV